MDNAYDVKISKLLEDISEAKMIIRQSTYELADLVVRFDGTIEDALRLGIVKLSFPAPAGFYKHLHSK